MALGILIPIYLIFYLLKGDCILMKRLGRQRAGSVLTLEAFTVYNGAWDLEEGPSSTERF